MKNMKKPKTTSENWEKELESINNVIEVLTNFKKKLGVNVKQNHEKIKNNK